MAFTNHGNNDQSPPFIVAWVIEKLDNDVRK